MNTRWRRRFQRTAALLLVGAAATAFAAPLADALEFHRGGAVATTGLHFDKRGGCDSHAEHCAITGHHNGLRFTTGPASRLPDARQDAGHPSGLRAIAAARPGLSLHHSRAPPVATV